MATTTQTAFNYRQAASDILQQLRQERDRQIVSLRFGLGMDRRQTLEKIGQQYGITRERVRQIEKAATNRLMNSNSESLRRVDGIFKQELQGRGHVSPLRHVAESLGATDPGEQAYIYFLATLAPSIEVIDDSDHYHPAVLVSEVMDRRAVDQVAKQVEKVLASHGQPQPLTELHSATGAEVPLQTLQNIAEISKRLANLDEHWGLSQWPQVNPRSIRDKTYLVLQKHGQPLHFSEIASRIGGLGQRKRDVTVQAVHNELIKDPRFVLVGRGIYALAEWGYTPGTVADVIAEVLREESPLHKDEIIRRVLKKRQVKTTTIVLNLQEKDQFVRVAKATYTLK